MPSDPTLSIQHSNPLLDTEGRNKIVVVVVTTTERKATMLQEDDGRDGSCCLHPTWFTGSTSSPGGMAHNDHIIEECGAGEEVEEKVEVEV
jgi:hypothetical protein